MEKELRILFDYQKFERNDNLQKLINETHKRVRSRALPDEVMSNISAAGSCYAGYEAVKEEDD